MHGHETRPAHTVRADAVGGQREPLHRRSDRPIWLLHRLAEVFLREVELFGDPP